MALGYYHSQTDDDTQKTYDPHPMAVKRIN
jgi:hypothetical protein